MQNVLDRAHRSDFVRLACHTANLIHRYYVEVEPFLAQFDFVFIENWTAWYQQQIGVMEYYNPQVPQPDLSILLDNQEGSHSAANYRSFYNRFEWVGAHIIIPKDHSA